MKANVTSNTNTVVRIEANYSAITLSCRPAWH